MRSESSKLRSTITIGLDIIISTPLRLVAALQDGSLELNKWVV